MSKLRPTLQDTHEPGLNYAATYFRVLDATAHCRGLIHGRLEDRRGHTCAIGRYFAESNKPINSYAIDEIASYNDSFPNLSEHKRWLKVRRWLKFQIALLKLGKKP